LTQKTQRHHWWPGRKTLCVKVACMRKDQGRKGHVEQVTLMKSSRVRKAWHEWTSRLGLRHASCRTHCAIHGKPATRVHKSFPKNLFSYQSCTKKGSQVFTTQCCPVSSLDPTLPCHLQKPQSIHIKETSNAAVSESKKGRKRKDNSQKSIQATTGISRVVRNAGKGRPMAIRSLLLAG
jgi:hypothetical protein